jgi:hypothetical protein
LIGFVAAFDESDAIFSEFSERIDDGIYGVHCCWREIGDRETLDRFIWDFFLFERAKNMRERVSYDNCFAEGTDTVLFLQV